MAGQEDLPVGFMDINSPAVSGFTSSEGMSDSSIVPADGTLGESEGIPKRRSRFKLDIFYTGSFSIL